MKLHHFIILIIIVFAMAGLSGCGAEDDENANTNQIIDLLGREVLIPDKVERIVAIGPGALRLYVYAGNPANVVGIEQIDVGSPTGRPYLLANPALMKLPLIGQGGPNNAPDPEKILAVAPDVIFSAYALETSTANELQTKTGIPVVALSYGGTGFGSTQIFSDEVQESLLLIGKISGSDEKAQAAVNFIRQAQRDLEARTKGISEADKPTVYVGGIGSKGAHGIESSQGQYPLLDVIHARNVVDETGKSGSIMIDKEMLLTWDPDFIFIDQSGFATVLEDYQKNPVFYASLSAVKKKNVYALLPYNNYNTNVDTALVDAYYLGKTLYPAAFSDIDPEHKADDIYQALLGKPVFDQMATVFGRFGALTLSTP